VIPEEQQELLISELFSFLLIPISSIGFKQFTLNTSFLYSPFQQFFKNYGTR
jgi:hypothetical protein